MRALQRKVAFSSRVEKSRRSWCAGFWRWLQPREISCWTSIWEAEPPARWPTNWGSRYIGVEQLDGQLEKALTRLPAVIAGERPEFPKPWLEGGGSFVCCELAKLNQAAVEAIEMRPGTKPRWRRFARQILDSGYVSYQVDPAMVNQEAACYEDLSLAQQKQFLMEILDKNLLYVNACDLDDAEFAVSDADKRFTRSFYGEG